MNKIRIFGAGLAGSEAAWQAAKRGVAVELYEMKPTKKSPAHHCEGVAIILLQNYINTTPSFIPK